MSSMFDTGIQLTRRTMVSFISIYKLKQANNMPIQNRQGTDYAEFSVNLLHKKVQFLNMTAQFRAKKRWVLS